MAGLIRKGTYLCGLFWVSKRWVDFHICPPNLKSLYKSPNWIQSDTQGVLTGVSHLLSPESLNTTFLSQVCIFGTTWIGKASEIHIPKHRGEEGERVQLRGQTDGNVFLITFLNTPKFYSLSESLKFSIVVDVTVRKSVLIVRNIIQSYEFPFSILPFIIRKYLIDFFRNTCILKAKAVLWWVKLPPRKIFFQSVINWGPLNMLISAIYGVSINICAKCKALKVRLKTTSCLLYIKT